MVTANSWDRFLAVTNLKSNNIPPANKDLTNNYGKAIDAAIAAHKGHVKRRRSAMAVIEQQEIVIHPIPVFPPVISALLRGPCESSARVEHC
jgi:hypothetical protein